MTTPILIIHGGVGSKLVVGEKHDRIRDSLARILAEAYPILSRGGSAVEAVTGAVELLENDPLFNAGYGSKIQQDGVIRMSSSLMDGSRGRFSGCVNVRDLKNPIRLAQLLQESENRVLAEEGAEDFARRAGLTFASPYTPERLKEHEQKLKGKSGTVGAIALDQTGKLAAATSTGGVGFEIPHRVSDSPTVAGNYANEHCALSATGTGERIVEFAIAARICSLVENGISLEKATKDLHSKASAANGEFGWIALDRHGNFSARTVTPSLTWGMARGTEITTNPN